MRSCQSGGSYARFRRALYGGNALVALAQELPTLNLADALALTCVLRTDPQGFEVAAVRWHVREVPGLSVADAALALAALGSMAQRFEAGAGALLELCEFHGRGRPCGSLRDRAKGN